MKSVRIHISKLGPIVDQEIQLAQMMLFTGDSNMGKSYTNFLCYYLLNLSESDRLNDFLLPRLKAYTDEVDRFEFNIKKDDLRLWIEADVKRFFVYLLAYPEIECEVHFYFDDAQDNIPVSITEFPDNNESPRIPVHLVVGGMPMDFNVTKGKKQDDVIAWIKRLIIRELIGQFVLNSIMMPPGRASLLSSSFTTQRGSSKMGLYEIFLGDNDRINFRNLRSTSQNEDQQFFISRIRKLIGGDLTFSLNGLELKLDTGQTIPIEAAASSIKELAPIIMWMKGSNTNMSYDSICIEEPEAHCHPMMQSQLAELLVACLNKGALMQITTHSDYLLKRINQLIRLHELEKENPERYNKYCETFNHTRSLTLDTKKIRAYYFHYSSENKQIIIEEQELSEGVPFDSFTQVIDREIEFDNFLEER